MSNKDWEQQIKHKLEEASADDLGYGVDVNSLWSKIENSKPSGKIMPFPVISHVAAVFIGILLSGAVYFLFFQNSNSVSNTRVSKPNLVFKPNKSTRLITKSNPPVQKKAVTINHPISPKTIHKNIAAQKNVFPTAISNKNEAEKSQKLITGNFRMANKVRPTTPGVQQNKGVQSSPPIAYWSEVEQHYAPAQQPKIWTKIARKYERRTNRFPDENSKTPIVAFIQTLNKK